MPTSPEPRKGQRSPRRTDWRLSGALGGCCPAQTALLGVCRLPHGLTAGVKLERTPPACLCPGWGRPGLGGGRDCRVTTEPAPSSSVLALLPSASSPTSPWYPSSLAASPHPRHLSPTLPVPGAPRLHHCQLHHLTVLPSPTVPSVLHPVPGRRVNNVIRWRVPGGPGAAPSVRALEAVTFAETWRREGAEGEGPKVAAGQRARGRGSAEGRAGQCPSERKEQRPRQ